MTRVLFVDDDPALLRGLERSLRMRRVPWETAFVEHGEAALAYIAAHAVDIVVSDLAMPVMDGMALLRELAEHHPHITRAVMSGNFGVGDTTSPLAHLWLAKPVPIAEVCEQLRPLLWARPLLAGAGRVPPIPAVLSRVADLDDAAVAVALALVDEVLGPQGFTGIASARQALGGERLRGVLLAAELAASLPADMVRDSRAIARRAAGLVDDPRRDDAWIAALLEGVGVLGEPPAGDAEVLARVGGGLLSTWGMPAHVAAAVAYRHAPANAACPDDPTLVTLVRAHG
nr:response regulator [Kofleriaceae bacterium]